MAQFASRPPTVSALTSSKCRSVPNHTTRVRGVRGSRVSQQGTKMSPVDLRVSELQPGSHTRLDWLRLGTLLLLSTELRWALRVSPALCPVHDSAIGELLAPSEVFYVARFEESPQRRPGLQRRGSLLVPCGTRLARVQRVGCTRRSRWGWERNCGQRQRQRR